MWERDVWSVGRGEKLVLWSCWWGEVVGGMGGESGGGVCSILVIAHGRALGRWIATGVTRLLIDMGESRRCRQRGRREAPTRRRLYHSVGALILKCHSSGAYEPALKSFGLALLHRLPLDRRL